MRERFDGTKLVLCGEAWKSLLESSILRAPDLTGTFVTASFWRAGVRKHAATNGSRC